MPRTLKILVVEDNLNDAELLLRNLTRSGFSTESIVVDTEKDFLKALESPWDIILSDFEMPRFSGTRALELLKLSGKKIPFIIVSGSIGEEVAVASMRQGADDYLLKDRMARLGSAVEQALEQHKLRLTSERAMQELRESEERFREVVESINEVFWMTDPSKHEMLYISPAYELIWGRKCADILRNPSDWLKAIHPDDRGRVAAAAKRQLKGNYDEVYRVVRPDESIRWVREKAFPIRDKNGKVLRIVGTAEDITENRRLEEQFTQAQKMEAIGTLAGGIAHDFNNILTAITGYTELIRMQVGNDAEVHSYLRALAQASSRATALVRQILAFSRKANHVRSPVHLRQVVEEALTLLRATIPATIAFDSKLDDYLPLVLADVTQIHQVMMNLGTNAAHAMNDKAGRLTVRLELHEVTEGFAVTTSRLHAGPHVRLTVGDNGSGMPPEVMHRMFEPFFTTKGPGEGTGLGLAVVHGVMQTHDGEVIVKTKEGEGTTFNLYFPVHLLPLEAALPEEKVEVLRGRGERILFIDDESPIMTVSKLMLQEIGYRVEGDTDAQSMLARIQAAPDEFDLIITDLTMPNITGLDFARQVLAIRRNLPIILVTGYSSTLTVERVRELGIRDMLIKPISMFALSTTVRRVLEETPREVGPSAAGARS